MAVLVDLTSFCLASTYDTLSSPTNFKKWRKTIEAMRTLCSKDVCSTAHILGACKVSIQQGRYTRGAYIINSAPILIIQICRFSNQGGQLIKDASFFSCIQSESNKHPIVPTSVEDEVFFTNTYPLIVTINHSGSLNRGHYWTFIKDSCNDRLVSNVEENFYFKYKRSSTYSF